MATPKQLVECIAKVTGVSITTVITHDRNLAKSGLRTVGGRGKGPATMTATDAANLLIAVTASQSVKDSANTVRHFAGQAASLAVDIQRCIDGHAPAKHYEFTLPSSGDAFFKAGFTGKTVAAVADLLRE